MNAHIIFSLHYNLQQTFWSYFTLNFFFREGELPGKLNLQRYLWFKNECVILRKVFWIFNQEREKNGRETSRQASSEFLFFTSVDFKSTVVRWGKHSLQSISLYKKYFLSFSKSLSWIGEEKLPVWINNNLINKITTIVRVIIWRRVNAIV